MQISAPQSEAQIIYLQTHLIVKSTCNQRFQIDEVQVSKMIATLYSSQWLPPIYVRLEGDKYGCFDGMHRLEAYRRCNMTQLPAIIRNVTDLEAKGESHRSNCGKVWTEAETAISCLELYQGGKVVKQIAVDLTLSEGCVRTYIKLAGFLHPNILKLVRKNSKTNGIPISIAELLCNANKDQQLLMLKEISNLSGNRTDNINNLFLIGKYQKFPCNITTLINTTTLITIAYLDAIHQTNPFFNPDYEFIGKINAMINNYCVTNNCNRGCIVTQLTNF